MLQIPSLRTLIAFLGFGMALPLSAAEPVKEEPALSVEALVKADAVRLHRAGAPDKTVYLNNIDLKLTLAADKTLGLPGGTFSLYLLSNHGARPNDYAGTFQGVDNIEVPISSTKMHEVWYEQAFGLWSARAGLYDLNSEFYVTEASALYLNPSFGVGPDIAQTGRNGPSIFPYASAGVRLSWRQPEGGYLQSVVLDGVPSDPNRPKGTHVRFDKGDGALWVTEGGWESSGADSDKVRRKLGLGLWRYSLRADDLIDTDAGGNPVKRVDAGYYFLFEHQLSGETGASARRTTGFLRYGHASAAINAVEHGLQTGVTVYAPFAGRPDDEAGLGIAIAKLGNKYRQAATIAGDPAPTSEIIYELSYRAAITDWLAIQPDMQWITYRGDANMQNGWAVSLRVQAGI
jgi:porin